MRLYLAIHLFAFLLVTSVARAQAPRNVNPTEGRPVATIATAIKDSVDLGPTLVIWLIDRTPSAREIVKQVTAATQNFYESPDAAQWSAAEAKPLLTALVSFDGDVQFVLDPPASDAQRVVAAFDEVKPSSVGREMTFAAVKKVLEKYLPLRTNERRELLLVVVTDEAGDDSQVVEALIDTTRR